jgi:hypothetical protein
MKTKGATSHVSIAGRELLKFITPEMQIPVSRVWLENNQITRGLVTDYAAFVRRPALIPMRQGSKRR